jgi:hypothetical protein
MHFSHKFQQFSALPLQLLVGRFALNCGCIAGCPLQFILILKNTTAGKVPVTLCKVPIHISIRGWRICIVPMALRYMPEGRGFETRCGE